jgi:hypothetical protein
MANSPLNQPTFASFTTWRIQRELVICRCKYGKIHAFFKIYANNFGIRLNFNFKLKL